MLMLFVFVAVGRVVTLSGHVEHHSHQQKANELKTKWGMESFIRDMDHIKEDVQSMMELTQIGEISDMEMTFYMIRMPDFDDNGGLDGIELRTALSHSLEHQMGEGMKEFDIESAIDQVLEADENNDGFLDYGELRRRKTT